jgi:uncharacterized membrane protein
MSDSPTTGNADPPVTDALLRALAGDGALDAAALTRARAIAGVTPSRATWFAFLERLFVIGGAAIASAAMVCFIAYNWDALGRWFRFALFEGAVLLFAAAATIFVSKPLLSKAFAVLAYFALGGLLAFVGQTYQTGADTYQLFFAWFALGLLFCLAANWWGMWLVAFVVLQICLMAWLTTDIVFSRAKFADWRAYVAIAINLLCFAGFYRFRQLPGLDSRWLWRIAAAASIAWCTMLAIVWGADSKSLLLSVIAAVVIAGGYFWASRIGEESFDATLLYVCAFAAISLTTWWLFRAIERVGDVFPDLLSLFAIYIAGTAAGATVWIVKLTKKHHTALAFEANGGAK